MASLAAQGSHSHSQSYIILKSFENPTIESMHDWTSWHTILMYNCNTFRVMASDSEVHYGANACSVSLVSDCGGYSPLCRFCNVAIERDGSSSYNAWYAQARVQNVAHSPLLKSKRSAAWLHINASTIVFSAGGPLYSKGADSYLDHLLQVLSPSLLCKSTPSIVSMRIWAIHRLCLLLPSSPSNEQMTHTDRTSCHVRICESCEQPLLPIKEGICISQGYLIALDTETILKHMHETLLVYTSTSKQNLH